MHSHCINKLLNLEDVIVKNIKHSDSLITILLETKPSEQVCPVCGTITRQIHDYGCRQLRISPFSSNQLTSYCEKGDTPVHVANISMRNIHGYQDINT